MIAGFYAFVDVRWPLQEQLTVAAFHLKFASTAPSTELSLPNLLNRHLGFFSFMAPLLYFVILLLFTDPVFKSSGITIKYSLFLAPFKFPQLT